MIFNFFALVGGRIIFGFGVGAMTVLTPLFISETSPIELAGPLGSLSQIMVTIGIMIAYILGFLVPIRYIKNEGETLNPDRLTTKSWRIIFTIPAVISIIQTILLLAIFRYDTPKFYKQIGDNSMHQKVEQIIYKEKASEEEEGRQLRTEDHKNERKVTLSELFSRKYRAAFFIGCCLAMFQQLSGINVVILYSNIVFTKGLDKGYKAEYTARIGTIIVGIVNWAATMVAIPLLTKLGRKTIMVTGQIIMGISLIVLGIFAITGWATGTIIFTLLFVAFFEIGIGSVLWLYLAEIMTEGGLSIATVVVWTLSILVGLFTPKMFDLLTPQGMYFLFAGFNITGLIFIVFLIKETKGKTKAQLSNLYSGNKAYQKLP